MLTKRGQRLGWVLDAALLGTVIVLSFRGDKLTALSLFVLVVGLFVVLYGRPRPAATKLEEKTPSAEHAQEDVPWLDHATSGSPRDPIPQPSAAHRTRQQKST